MVTQKIKTYYIYAHLNIITAKIYIGYSKNPKKRWIEHYTATDSTYFHKAIQKYGVECFERFIIAYSINGKEIKQKEKDLIKRFNTMRPNGYNLTKGGDGNESKHTKETKKKMSESHIGKKGYWEGKKNPKHSKKMKGRKRPDFSKIVTKRNNENNPMKDPKIAKKSGTNQKINHIKKLRIELKKLEQKLNE